ncbi:MAG: DUF3096 domain-containing protein [Gallionella sp.]|nr:DUF3096 domain-containing protein [Gallionella sp.]
MNIAFSLRPLVSLRIGVLILIVPRLLNDMAAAYLIVARIGFCIRRLGCLARMASV